MGLCGRCIVNSTVHVRELPGTRTCLTTREGHAEAQDIWSQIVTIAQDPMHSAFLEIWSLMLAHRTYHSGFDVDGMKRLWLGLFFFKLC